MVCHKKHTEPTTNLGTPIPTKILPFRQCETIAVYYKDSAKFIDDLIKTHELPHLTHLLLDATFRAACRQKTNRDEHNRNITNELRSFRDCNRFDTVKSTHSRKRKAEGIAQRTEAKAIGHECV